MRLILSAFCCAWSLACSGGGQAELPAQGAAAGAVPLGVRVARPTAALSEGLARVSGILRARNEAVLSAPVTGTIGKVVADVGATVKSGEALILLDSSNAQIAVEQALAAHDMAQAGLDVAKLELERVQQLLGKEAATRASVDRAVAVHKQALAAHAQAEAAMRAAQDHLADHTLRAPFAGVVTGRFKSLGETVAMVPPTPIIAIAEVGRLEVRLPVPEPIVAMARSGALVRGRVSPSRDEFEAKVRTVGATVDPASRTVEVIADVTSALGPQMRPGALVEVELSSGEAPSEGHGVYVPAQAVLARGDLRFVFVVKDGVAQQRTVVVEPVMPGTLRVREGLGTSDDVVIEGAAGLVDGAHVRASS